MFEQINNNETKAHTHSTNFIMQFYWYTFAVSMPSDTTMWLNGKRWVVSEWILPWICVYCSFADCFYFYCFEWKRYLICRKCCHIITWPLAGAADQFATVESAREQCGFARPISIVDVRSFIVFLSIGHIEHYKRNLFSEHFVRHSLLKFGENNHRWSVCKYDFSAEENYFSQFSISFPLFFQRNN